MDKTLNKFAHWFEGAKPSSPTLEIEVRSGLIKSKNASTSDLSKLFAIQLKNAYNSHNFIGMFEKLEDTDEPQWERFYNSAKKDMQATCAKHWMIVWCKDGRPEVVYIQSAAITCLVEAGARKLNSVPHMKGAVRSKRGKKISVYVCTLSDFFKSVKPEHIRKASK